MGSTLQQSQKIPGIYLQQQGKQQDYQKHKGIDCADEPGPKIPPGFRHMINGIEAGEYAVDPPAGGPKNRDGGKPQNR